MAPTTLSNVTAPRVSDEHPFHDAQTGEWRRADALEPGDLLSALGGEAEVLSILFDQQRVPVYNLSIPSSPTYYVGQHGLWVHNCVDFPQIDFKGVRGFPAITQWEHLLLKGVASGGATGAKQIMTNLGDPRLQHWLKAHGINGRLREKGLEVEIMSCIIQ